MDSIKMTTEQQLPEGWEYVPFNMFFNVVSISDKKISQKEYLNNGKYPVIDQGNLFIGGYSNDESLILKISSPVIVFGDHTKCFKYVSFPFVAGADGIKVLEPQNGIYPKYAYYYCLSIDLIDRGYSRHFAFLKKCQFLIVPIETQQAIVNKIESLFDEIDEGIGRLKTAAQQIQQYRQSLLKNAFNGALTKEWRSKHADTLPSENELLTQIQTAREQHHAQQLADWQTAVSQWEQNGKEGKKPSKPKKLREFIQLEGSFSNLPKGWCWVELSGISSVIRIGPFGSLLHKADYINNQIPLINPSHIKNGKIIPDFQLTVSKEKLNELNNYIMRENDIVIGRRGEMGRCAVVTSNENGWLCGTGSMFVRPLNSVSSKFYAYIISSERVKDYLSNSSIGTTMQNLNEKILQTVPVPLCSTQEQLEILRILDVNLTACDQLTAELAKQLKQAELLKQAVLKAAFSGNLLDK